MQKRIDRSVIITIVLLLITSITGILSMNFDHKWVFTNQYGHTVEMYGYGIYANDTYLKAPINIGTDWIILLLVIPILVVSYIQFYKNDCTLNRLKMASIYGVITYYAASICFGVTYNQLFLVYAVLFGISLFKTFIYTRAISLKKVPKVRISMTIFLYILGGSLFVAWLPDIIPAVLNNTTLSSIGVYTTEITYVIDMAIVSPLIFISLYLLKKRNPLGAIIYDIILELCVVVGIIVISQSIIQMLSHVEMPLPVMITKVGIFVVLGGFALYFRNKLHKEIA
ncbi:hypothetical protein [Anaerosporobacter faecicola]|uniref:hypothetical protein n=1 Tax=Anaerosporobacter faecicola TaxID=2718714 RepID=UPI0014397779|nr:hypothetical protein [Anaerosporobacter faecicola]